MSGYYYHNRNMGPPPQPQRRYEPFSNAYTGRLTSNSMLMHGFPNGPPIANPRARLEQMGFTDSQGNGSSQSIRGSQQQQIRQLEQRLAENRRQAAIVQQQINQMMRRQCLYGGSKCSGRGVFMRNWRHLIAACLAP
ncbi:hypothetical protein GLAREA_03449 [Glarea lozoyensis ATCC 20868]|uniref:Uncharacterized protein n=1 Tax=Glarea lozoyensis (strain ATCC 20868 / MF5171) TaxID=1116229 RepID=S3CVP2_GLAL2|nr:uncharacterized protein GLAREA_03449 [Glarea lozoyensis ATCC 20868]EPE30482.1 hypothetical protein GLAREA_03449 [Glarea lozoyensis ATCC 20868]